RPAQHELAQSGVFGFGQRPDFIQESVDGRHGFGLEEAVGAAQVAGVEVLAGLHLAGEQTQLQGAVHQDALVVLLRVGHH
nr:hypothetical protein [Tanacetum cinerariifolium]